MAREELADTVLQKETKSLNKALRKQIFSKEALRALQEPMITAFLATGLYVAMTLFGLSLATVALDLENKMAIGRTLQQLRGKLTIIAISHQPALVKAADLAYRLQDGLAEVWSDRSEHAIFQSGSGFETLTASG